MPNWSVLIPLAPQGKARARVVRTKRGRTIAFTPAKTARYEEQILRFAAASWGARPRVQGPVFVDVSAAMPVPRSWKLARREAACDGFISHTSRPDLDNIIKGALDAISGLVFTNDTQVVSIKADKFYAAEPSLRISVRWQ